MKLRNILVVCAFLLAPVLSSAAEWSNKSLSVFLPDKWAVDTYKYGFKTADTAVFARAGDDYPLARVWTLPKGVRSTSKDLFQQIAIEPEGKFKVTLDANLRQNDRPARRIDYFFKAHSDAYFHSVIVIDPVGDAPSIALDIFCYIGTSFTEFPPYIPDRDYADKMLLLQKEFRDMLTSFKQVGSK